MKKFFNFKTAQGYRVKAAIEEVSRVCEADTAVEITFRDGVVFWTETYDYEGFCAVVLDSKRKEGVET